MTRVNWWHACALFLYAASTLLVLAFIKAVLAPPLWKR